MGLLLAVVIGLGLLVSCCIVNSGAYCGVHLRVLMACIVVYCWLFVFCVWVGLVGLLWFGFGWFGFVML